MLRDNIPAILEHIKLNYENQIIYNAKVLEIYRGQLKKHVELSMMMELSPESFLKSKERIPPINLLQQYVRKTNRTYDEPAIREIVDQVNTLLSETNSVDEELLTNAEETLDINDVMKKVSDYLTAFKYCAVELANQNYLELCRVLDPTQFMVWTDNIYNPTTPTVFIKFIGDRNKRFMQTTDYNGKTLNNPIEAVRKVQIYHLYDADTFIEIDSEGDITIELPNEYGQLPFLYVRENEDELVPTPDSDIYQMAVLIPKMLADINYALQFCTHSVMYGIDVDETKVMTHSPDSFWSLQSVVKPDGTTVSPEIGTISPSVDSDKANNSIAIQLAMWLESKGLKTGTIGKDANSASGISKMVDESDASSVRKDKVRIMGKTEQRFWKLYKDIREVWCKQGRLLDNRPFTKDCKFSIQFSEQQPLADFNTTLDEVKKMQDMGLITPEMALKKLYPNKAEIEIEEMLMEIEAHSQEKQQQAMDLMSQQSNNVVNGNDNKPAMDNTNKDNTDNQGA